MEMLLRQTGEVDDVDNEKKKYIENKEGSLIYGLRSTPPWYLTLLFAFQLVLLNIGICIVMSIIITETVCADALFTSKIFATMCVMAGVTTVLQTLLGARLPIFQGPTIIGLLPYMDAKDDPRWRCNQNMTELYLSGNFTEISEGENAWDSQWRKVQGSLMIAAALECVFGLTGLVGLLSKVIRPVSITVFFILLGVYLWEMAASLATPHWGVAAGSCVLIILFSMYLDWIKVPVPNWSRSSGWTWYMFPLFELFPLLVVILVGWAISHVITVCGGFTDDPNNPEYQARTDINSENIANAPAFRFPYPGQFGYLDFDTNYIVFYIPCIVASMMESIADYYQYALSCKVPPPPAHASNRGIAMEGLGGIISAWLGAGHPTTSYSNIMGIISITKVASRSVMIVAGIILAIIGVIGPVAAVLVSIPKPVLFGPFILSISLLVGLAFRNLETVKLAHRRNQFILGISIFLSVVISFWVTNTPNAIKTSSDLFNSVATGILKITFLVGVVISVFLDMTLKDREKVDPSETFNPSGETEDLRVYDLPFVGEWMRRFIVFRYIPFLPGPETNPNECNSGLP